MTNASPSPAAPAINAPSSATTGAGPLGAEVALALRIESNDSDSPWAADLRRRLQERNTHVADVCDALLTAIRRVELANSEGDPILSAWLPDARAALARVDSRAIAQSAN